MQTYADLLVALHVGPWALASGELQSLIAFAKCNAYSGRVGPARPAAARGGGGRGGSAARTAVIPIIGYIEPRVGLLSMLGLGVSCPEIAGALREALADPGVDRIVLEIDSQGGSVFGVDELATEIRAARATKPVIGVANSVAGSAAYWIGSACSELYVTPGGQVGSIGIVIQHEDVSKALEAEGVRITLITAGLYKAEGNSFGPLGSVARAQLQSEVDGYGADFTQAVARGRNVPVESVRRDMGRGRMMRADAALAANMIDGIATFDAVLRGRAAPSSALRGRAGPGAGKTLSPNLAWLQLQDMQ